MAAALKAPEPMSLVDDLIRAAQSHPGRYGGTPIRDAAIPLPEKYAVIAQDPIVPAAYRPWTELISDLNAIVGGKPAKRSVLSDSVLGINPPK